VGPTILLISGCLLFVLAAIRWREATLLAVFLVLFEGALRKWVFSGGQELVFFIKDFLLLGAYAGYFFRRNRQGMVRLPHHPANAVLALLAVVCGIQVLNPRTENLVVALYGVRAYLIYIPLMYVVPSLFPDAASLRRFLAMFLLAALVPLIVGIAQFGSPADSVFNRYVGQDEAATVFGATNKPRISSTFSYISGHTTFLTVMLLMCFPFVVYARSLRTRLVIVGVLSLTLVNVLMSGSRGPLVIAGGALLVFLVSSMSGGVGQFLRTVLTVALVLMVMSWAAVNAFPEAFQAFMDRAVGSEEEVTQRSVSPVANLPSVIEESGWSGYGIGATNQAARKIEPRSGSAVPGAENEWDRILLELGPVGFLLVVIARLQVCGALWAALRAAGGSESRPLLVGAFLVSVASLPGNLVFNNTASIGYWFLAGFAFLPAWTDQGETVNAHTEPTRACVALVGSPARNGSAR